MLSRLVARKRGLLRELVDVLSRATEKLSIDWPSPAANHFLTDNLAVGLIWSGLTGLPLQLHQIGFLIGVIEEVPQSDLERGFFSRYFLVPKTNLVPICVIWISPFTKGSSRCWCWRLLCLRFEWETGLSLSTWKMPISTFRSSGGTGSSFGSLLEGRLVNTKFFPLAWLWCRWLSKNAWMPPWPRWGSRTFVYSIIWTIGSFWPTPGSQWAVTGMSSTKKSVLSPSQQILFLGVHLDSVQMQARLAPAQISSLNTCLAHFKLDHHFSVSTCHRLLGLMATASPVLPLGLLHMRPFLWWTKLLWFRSTGPATRCFAFAPF